MKIADKLREKIEEYCNHPRVLKIILPVFFSGIIANSSLYKRSAMKKAKRVAKENKEFKDRIMIETALTCNSRCIFCGHHNKPMTGIMPFELFKKIIDDCSEYGINKIILGVYGEIFTDKDILEKIKYLRGQGMTYHILTNGSLLFPPIAEQLLQMGGLTEIFFSVNAFSKEIYEKTMVGLKRDVTYKNILYFIKLKEMLGKKDLRINISAVETNVNKKDLKLFFLFWRKQKGIYKVESGELIDRMGKKYDGSLGKFGPRTKKTNWLSPCKMIWGPLNVYYDGKVGPCCKDNDTRELIVGDLTKQTVAEVSTGAALNNLRQCHLAGRRRDHPVCKKCYLNSVWLR